MSPATEATDAVRAKLVKRAGIVGAGTLLSRMLGLARDMALAGIFKRSETDAFFVAFTIPNALRQVLGEGAVSSAVVPVLTQTLEQEGDAGAQRLFARIRGVSLVLLAIVTGAGVLAAAPLSELFAHGYTGEELRRTVQMTALVFPYIFFMGTAALGMAALNSKRKFAVAAFAPGLLNVAFLLAAFLAPPLLVARGMDPSMAMPLGALLGGLLQVVAQWPALRAIGFFGRPRLVLRDPQLAEIGRRLLPTMVGVGIYYVDLVLSRRFLSEAGTGAQSYFSWATRLCDFPQGVFVMALSTAALPSLSSLAAKKDMDALVQTFAHGIGLALFVAIPASVVLAVLGEPVVVMLFVRGEFDVHAAVETARSLVWQGGAIWTVAAVRQIVPVFYALGDTRTPVAVSALDLVAFIVLAVVLRGTLGHVGISIAVGGSSFVQMVLLVLALKRRLGRIGGRELLASIGRTALASGVGGIAGFGVAHALSAMETGNGVLRVIPGAAALAVFGFAFLVVGKVTGSPELDTVLRAVSRRLRGRVR